MERDILAGYEFDFNLPVDVESWKAPISPKPTGKPQTVPPIRQNPVEKKHITKDGKR